jgi:hypothetical protein
MLRHNAAREGARLHEATDEDSQAALAAVTEAAEYAQRADAARARELARWALPVVPPVVPLAPFSVVRHLMLRSAIGTETLLGDIAAYLLIGMFFAFAYKAAGQFGSMAFSGPASTARSARIVPGRRYLLAGVCRPVTDMGRIRIQNGRRAEVPQGCRLRWLNRETSASAFTTSARPLTSTLHSDRVCRS